MHMTDEDALVEELARSLAVHDGYDPDETWQEFDRSAALSLEYSLEPGEQTTPEWEEQVFPTFVRWKEYESKARAILPIVNSRLDAVAKERDELRAKTLKVENCILCADECRGHSLGDSAAWEPEEGSRDWLNFQLAAAQEKLAMAEGALRSMADAGVHGEAALNGKGCRALARTTLVALREPAVEEKTGYGN
jgi:hypothetical protein